MTVFEATSQSRYSGLLRLPTHHLGEVVVIVPNLSLIMGRDVRSCPSDTLHPGIADTTYPNCVKCYEASYHTICVEYFGTEAIPKRYSVHEYGSSYSPQNVHRAVEAVPNPLIFWVEEVSTRILPVSCR